PAVRSHLVALTKLAQAYKQINAPVGALGLKTLQISTTALSSNSTNDVTYVQLEKLLTTQTTVRNMLAARMIATLEAAEFGGSASNAQASDLANQAGGLLK